MLKSKLQYFGHLMQRTDSLWKRPWCWERLKAGRKRDGRGWDGWMASPTRWTWVWASSRTWWWTWKPGVLKSIGLQRVVYDWGTELNWCFPKEETEANLPGIFSYMENYLIAQQGVVLHCSVIWSYKEKSIITRILKAYLRRRWKYMWLWLRESHFSREIYISSQICIW